MSWRLVAPIILVAMACGNEKSKLDTSAATGPVYLPSVAYALRAIAPECKLLKTGAIQTRDCTGRIGTVAIALGEGDHFTKLAISLRSMLLPEAKGHLMQPIVLLLGDAGRDQAFAAIDKLETGQSADLVIGQAKIAVSAGGHSRLAPEYAITITW